MRVRTLRTVGLAAFFCSLPFASTPQAQAEDEKTACASSYENAQTLNRKAELLSARDAMRACAREVCPSFIKNDCIQWLADVEKNIPSVVLSAQVDGKDVHDVSVEMDGRPYVDSLEGHAAEVNPGRHTFLFKYKKVPTQPTQEVVAVVVEGQKNRPVQSTYTTPPPPPDEIHRPVPTSVYLLLGTGVLAMGSFATFSALGLSKRNDLANTSSTTGCSPFCSDSQVKPVKTDFLVGDISLAAGVVALGTAAIVFLARPTIVIRPKNPYEAAKANLTPIVDVDIGTNVRALRVGARF
jgi:hypothetical protein